LRKIYFILTDKLNITPSEADKLDFYMIEYLLEDLEEKIDEENKRFKKQEEEYKKESQSYKTPKMPKVGSTDYGGFKTPKLDMPKLTMPNIPTPKF